MRPEITIRTETDEIEHVECEHCRGTGRVPGQNAGAVLRTEREKAGLPLAAIADEMDISAAYLGDLERGNRALSNERVKQFRAAIVKLKDYRK
jgi:predicted transcriptional regulator